jgi:hypothetical protein
MKGYRSREVLVVDIQGNLKETEKISYDMFESIHLFSLPKSAA